MIPLANRLGRKEFIDLATLQDLFVESLYEVDNTLVLHGGTAIWRCYKGNRFSYDIDVYSNANARKKIANGLTWSLSKRGVNLDKIRVIGNSLAVYASAQDVHLKADIVDDKNAPSSVTKDYERADGNLMSVLTLIPEGFITEKIATYSSRKYVRDLYDIYQLLAYVQTKGKITVMLKKFLKSYETPVDEKELKSLVYSGIAPSADEMIEYIRGKLK